MNREVHVRFWESPEVKVLRATRPSRRFDAAQQFGRFLSEADMNKIYEYAPSPA